MMATGTAVIGADNRGLRYGDGLFETIKYRNNELVMLDEHFSRLWKGMQLLQFEIPKLFTPDLLQQQIILLLKKNKLSSARVRLSVYRADGGLYDTKHHAPLYIIQAWSMEEKTPALNENGLQLCIYKDAIKSIDKFCNIKHNNFLAYLMGALFAKQQQCNDAIILNMHGRICDTTIANIFLVKNEIIYTSSLEEGCIAGTMRKFILQNLPDAEYETIESAISVEQLLDADEIFLTNSIYNIRWVAAIGDKSFGNNVTKDIFNHLLKTNPAVFC